MSKRSSTWVLVAVAALAFSAAAVFSTWTASSEPASETGKSRTGLLDQRQLALDEPAPDFELVSVRDERKVIRLSDLRGKAVVVNFYASWCGPCRQELPDFEIVSHEFSDRVVILAVNAQESPASALGILRDTGATFPAVLDTNGEVARRYGVRGMPSTYLLDASGVVRKFGPGALDADTLRTELRTILANAR